MTTSERRQTSYRRETSYQQWVTSLNLPIHTGYYHEDLRTAEVGWWAERGCNAAFIQLVGLESAEIKVMEIPPGKTLQPWKFALDDVIYVLEGRGLTTVWGAKESARKTFEWQARSFFLLPRHSFCQLTNAQGDKPARLLSLNSLPLAMEGIEEPEFFFNNPYLSERREMLDDSYSQAKRIQEERRGGGSLIMTSRGKEVQQGWSSSWYGNFFPDLAAWDKLDRHEYRGAGGFIVWFRFPNSSHRSHMSVFPELRYKKAHCHVAGPLIVIPAGEGYSLIWEEGKEKIVVPWHEGSCFAPQFYHQHFNLGQTPARYLAIAIAGSRQYAERYYTKIEVEYPDENPWIRQHFEEELAKKGLTSLMPDGVWEDVDYQWEYAADSSD